MIDKFNFSYSTYDTYCKSQLWFYFMKIAKHKASDVGMQVYGDAGNVVHNAIECFIKKGIDTFDHHWDGYNIDSQFGFKNLKLSKEKFKDMYQKAIDYYNSLFNQGCLGCLGSSITELRIEKEFFGMNFKGFIDFYTQFEDKIVIYDWKTNSNHDHQTHYKQRLLYSWFIWKIKGIIPLCRWVYLSKMQIIEEKFTEKDLENFEIEIKKFISDIQNKGDNINNYEGGDWNNPFNKYYSLCREVMEERQKSKYIEIHLNIKGNFVFFAGDMDSKLEKGIDFATKFDLPDKYFMQEAVKKKGRGRINISDIGTVHLYNKKFKCFPIGLLDKVTKICKDFASYYNKEIKIFLHDKRDPEVLNRTYGGMPEKLNTNKVFRDYQVDCIKTFLEKNCGIVQIATGGGKTFIATELIRIIDGQTLWIIDRKELLEQTKEVLENLLNIKIGVIAGGKVDIQQVTIATIQSVNSKLSELKDYLYKVNFVIVDEFHKSAAESYQKVFAKLPNTKYRLGLTATPTRDDGKTPILYSILGDIIYKCTTQDLIDMGYLVKPTIQFYNLAENNFSIEKTTYSEDYSLNIVGNSERNSKICDIVTNNKDKKIIILTKQVDHGKTIQSWLSDSLHIHGKSKDREESMKKFRSGECKVLIMTNSIGAEGLDIPDLDIIINAAANKGDVKSIQVLGRVLRIFKTKSKALYIDFIDCGYHTQKHSDARINAFKQQGHEVNIIE